MRGSIWLSRPKARSDLTWSFPLMLSFAWGRGYAGCVIRAAKALSKFGPRPSKMLASGERGPEYRPWRRDGMTPVIPLDECLEYSSCRGHPAPHVPAKMTGADPVMKWVGP